MTTPDDTRAPVWGGRMCIEVNGGHVSVGDEVYLPEASMAGGGYRLSSGEVIAILPTRTGTPLLKVQTGAAHQTTLRWPNECWKDAP